MIVLAWILFALSTAHLIKDTIDLVKKRKFSLQLYLILAVVFSGSYIWGWF